jgi:hypothetical protein
MRLDEDRGMKYGEKERPDANWLGLQSLNIVCYFDFGYRISTICGT